MCLRDGELRGLQWGDIDFEGRTVRVQRQLDERGGVHPPKSGKSRNVRLTPDAADALRALPKKSVFVFVGR